MSYCVTERLTVPGRKPLGVMLAEVYPSGLTPDDEARVVEEARRGAAALGHVRGPCYSQVALGPSGCVLFETAARLGGGFDADVTRLASGVDLYDRVLGVAVGDPGARAPGRDRAGARRAPSRSSWWRAPARCAPSWASRGARARRRRRRGGVRPRRRARAAADRQREARGVRPFARGDTRRGDGARGRGARPHPHRHGEPVTSLHAVREVRNGRTGSSTVWQLFKERRTRDALYGVSSYWDSRASARRGMARSLWPSNAYNAVWDERQRVLLGEGARRRQRAHAWSTWAAAPGASRAGSPSSAAPRQRRGRRLLAGDGRGGAPRVERAGVVRASCASSRGTWSTGLDTLGVGVVRRRHRARLLLGGLRAPRVAREGHGQRRAPGPQGRPGAGARAHPSFAAASPRPRPGARGVDRLRQRARASRSWRGDRMGFVPVRLVFSVRDLPALRRRADLRRRRAAARRAPWLAPLADYKLLLFTRGMT